MEENPFATFNFNKNAGKTPFATFPKSTGKSTFNFLLFPIYNFSSAKSEGKPAVATVPPMNMEETPYATFPTDESMEVKLHLKLFVYLRADENPHFLLKLHL